MQYFRTYVALLLLVSGGLQLAAQPGRLAYFPDDTLYLAAMDPGDEILARNLILTNQHVGANVSFSLSFDKENWNGFALGPRYSSLFDLQGLAGCYVQVRTRLSKDVVTEKQYYLPRGRCFSFYYNRQEQCWDVVENRCRR